MRAGAAAYGAYEPPKIPYSGSIILAKIKKKVNSVIVNYKYRKGTTLSFAPRETSSS